MSVGFFALRFVTLEGLWRNLADGNTAHTQTPLYFSGTSSATNTCALTNAIRERDAAYDKRADSESDEIDQQVHVILPPVMEMPRAGVPTLGIFVRPPPLGRHVC